MTCYSTRTVDQVSFPQAFTSFMVDRMMQLIENEDLSSLSRCVALDSNVDMEAYRLRYVYLLDKFLRLSRYHCFKNPIFLNICV